MARSHPDNGYGSAVMIREALIHIVEEQQKATPVLHPFPKISAGTLVRAAMNDAILHKGNENSKMI